jgi:tRNA G10  N-methylase Trm11
MGSMEDKAVDVLFADPPYGVGMPYDGYEDTKDNLKKLIADFMPQALRVAKLVVLTPGNSNQSLYPEPTWTMAFFYHGSGLSRWGFNCWQPITVYGDDPYLAHGLGARPDAFEAHGVSRPSDHPCPKPDQLMNWIINRVSLPGQTILDPFMGTGTTGRACARLGRHFIGVEQSKRYFEIAQHDIAEVEAQDIMFDSVKWAQEGLV